jgi:hypothetical protein
LAHHDRVGEAAQQHDERDDDVHHADLLVIDAREPFAPQPFPSAGDRQGRENADHDQPHEGARPHDDRLVERNRRKCQFAEHALSLRAAGGVLQVEDVPSLYFAMMLWKSRGSTDEK